MSKRNNKPPYITDSRLSPEMVYNHGEGRVKFKEISLKQDCMSFLHGGVVNLYC